MEDSMAFHGQVALVTGGGSGMGQVAAWKLADTGAQVAILDVDQEGMDRTAQGRDNVHPFLCDVTELERVRVVIQTTEDAYGPIDRVVHAAGIMPGALVLEEDPLHVKKVMDVNYVGTVNVLTSTLPKMVERRRGDFIAFGSTAGYCPTPYLGAYCASKAAINFLIETAYWETRNSGVRIILAAPPPVNTPLLDQVPTRAKAIWDMRDKNQTMTAEAMIDAIERDLEKGKMVSTGNSFGRTILLMRRFMPTRLWKMALEANDMLG
jgi:NAD(P)-dependent dehydrogenase (short-subunit alcohol dehydrogenase family)